MCWSELRFFLKTEKGIRNNCNLKYAAIVCVRKYLDCQGNDAIMSSSATLRIAANCKILSNWCKMKWIFHILEK